MDVTGVVSLRELLTDNSNLTIELVGHDRQEVEQSLTELNSLGVDIERLEMLKRERKQPYNHFGKEHVDAENTG